MDRRVTVLVVAVVAVEVVAVEVVAVEVVEVGRVLKFQVVCRCQTLLLSCLSRKCRTKVEKENKKEMETRNVAR